MLLIWVCRSLYDFSISAKDVVNSAATKEDSVLEEDQHVLDATPIVDEEA